MPEYKESAHLLLRSDLPWIRQFTFTSFPEKCSCQFLGRMRHLHPNSRFDSCLSCFPNDLLGIVFRNGGPLFKSVLQLFRPPETEAHFRPRSYVE